MKKENNKVYNDILDDLYYEQLIETISIIETDETIIDDLNIDDCIEIEKLLYLN